MFSDCIFQAFSSQTLTSTALAMSNYSISSLAVCDSEYSAIFQRNHTEVLKESHYFHTISLASPKNSTK